MLYLKINVMMLDIPFNAQNVGPHVVSQSPHK